MISPKRKPKFGNSTSRPYGRKAEQGKKGLVPKLGRKRGEILSLCRNFQACFNLSPMEYLSKIRIDHAKELLLTTYKPVTDIAFECGFNDSNYFSKTFRNSVGCTPKNYRQERKKCDQTIPRV